MRCNKCGEELPDNTKYCTKCGHKVEKEKDNRILISVIIVLAIAVIVCVIAVIALLSRKDDSVAPDSGKKFESELSDDIEEDDEIEIEEEVLIDDPLEGNSEVVFIGEYDRDDNNTRKFLKKLIEEKNVDVSTIHSVCCSDFDNSTESCGAFVFAGTHSDDEYEDYFEGSFWYVDEDEITELDQSYTEMWQDSGRYFDFGDRKFFVASEHYTTGATSLIWTVDGGKLRVSSMSGCGFLEGIENGVCKLISSEYDAGYDIESHILLGHTWKPYYCGYSKECDDLAEYIGAEFDIEKADAMTDGSITSRMNGRDECYVVSGFYRSNGICNINYLSVSEYDTSLENATWDDNNKTFIDAWNVGTKGFDESDYYGYYKSCMTAGPYIEAETEKPITRELSIIVYGNNLVKVDDFDILYGHVWSEEEPVYERMGFIIDENTKLSFSSDSALEWIEALHNATEEDILMGNRIEGAYYLKVTGSHIDEIISQGWWD